MRVFIHISESEVEEEVAEERPPKRKEQIEPGYDIHLGSEDLRTLKESDAVIY